MSRKLWALLGALILIAGLGFLTWPANAGTGGNSYYTWAWTVTPTRCADKGQANGAAQVVFTNTSSRQYYADMTVPIDVVAIGDVSPGQTVTETVDSRQAPDGLPAGTSYWALYIEDGQVDAQQVTIAQCALPTPKDATASVSVSKATCQAAGVATASTEHASLQGTLDETPGTHTAHFVADAGHEFADGSDAKDVDYTISGKLAGSQCGVLTNVTPTAPVFTDKCGTANDTYTIPSNKGVSYEVGGTVKAAGTYKATGTVTVKAVARKGYTVVGTSSWSRTFTNKTCGSTGGGNGNGSGNTGSNGNGNGGGHHHGHHGHHAGHGHGNNPTSGTHSGSSGTTGSSSTTSSTSGSRASGSGAPETGISSEASPVNTVLGLGLIGVAIFGSGILLWRRPRATIK